MALSKHLLALMLAGLSYATRDHKRGLCFVPNTEKPQDDKIWVQNGSDITWYYNYGDKPSAVYKDVPQEQFEFVPMMWGVGSDSSDTTFLQNVKSLMEDGVNITHVLGFNEPDAGNDVGGSNLDPKVAAEAWVANFEPLGEMGVKLGLPACTGGWGSMPWLKQFLGNCSAIKSQDGPKRNCTWDYLPVHWYDNFEGLASHIGERLAEWPNSTIWVTEYAYAHQDPQLTEQFFKQTLKWFDESAFIGRYTYFGAFRSDVSNVGPNAAFLSNSGGLTTIGAQYLGLNTTGENNASHSKVSLPSVGLLAVVLAVVVKTIM
ncbi:hypothetical protein RAB80_013422 [Fusarium oxysporum f. sp. vasinfectum]|uniref:Asl1-like glycosyl hydrolase catalytic domain-containing protein n=1 Tax=Fusarium oxysporum f. sp. vasinfectum 25433 TaxID=1089449 RepID=X0LND3_FUSOX|nr:hypothetical protein FOTG_06689 [Fusarium oxysporum f. sp. vasinfectum 25433]KAK2671000.1 hypothetical protein RAB80_013422 [Fusarium oxysporum f. sp. vasinfectum]KAK2691084.1 hypothetical protein QWA68_011049 [Fusarium oxysporum]KAK2927448.1 hypothetical protein FoTM2_012622 [Fusarium oxysporum f. sp. vasinfectum]